MVRKLLLLGIIIITGCSTSQNISHPTTSSTLWIQRSAEYDAITTLIYRTAANNLDLASEDSYWTALPIQEQTDNSFYKLPPAVILDVDETVLDNSPFQARMIKQNSSFDSSEWGKWVRESNADPVPGSLSFTQYAISKGITVFYITNRDHELEEATRNNLLKLGFPLADSIDVLLTKNEREDWNSDKTNRRKYVRTKYRVLMIFGDDLNDFVAAKNKTLREREKLVEENEKMWGNKWFILPNPVYGSWE